MSSKGKQKVVRLLFSLVFSLLCWGSPRLAAASDDHVDNLVRQAHDQAMYRDRYWHILLHYRQTPSGTVSLIDDPRFFLAEDGRQNPKSELEATIRAFFKDPAEGGKHPVCRFAARFEWLKAMLPFDKTRLPFETCADFNRILAEISPASASLIFPTSHMNSPASMFGHTLLTVDTENQSRLLSYAINYAAVTDETFGPTFAVKGLFGFYKGYFSILPYYTKLQEYSDIDHRDIWEYRLGLTVEEITRMLLHLYELDGVYSDYYFFNENCSYILLFLLDAARPGLNLTDQSKWWVVPLDTVKLVQTNDLVADVNFRPSKTTKIRHLADLTSNAGQQHAISIATGRLAADSLQTLQADPVDQIRAADLAIAYLQYRYARHELSKESYLSTFLPALDFRSRLGDLDADRPELPAPTPPDLGHDPGRFSIASGFRDDVFFHQIRFRPANHELLDDSLGYQKGAQINFLDSALRYYPEGGDLLLEDFDLIDIMSISPRDIFFNPVSWKIATGVTRKTVPGGGDSLVTFLEGGGGVAYEVGEPGLWYGMLLADVNLGNGVEDGYGIGVGVETGFTGNMGARLTYIVKIRDVAYLLGDTHNEFEGMTGVNCRLANNMALGVELRRTFAHNDDETEGLTYWNVYF